MLSFEWMQQVFNVASMYLFRHYYCRLHNVIMMYQKKNTIWLFF